MKPATRSLVLWLAGIWLLAVLSALGLYAFGVHQSRSGLVQRLSTAARAESALETQRLVTLQLRANHLDMDPAFVDYVAQSLVPNPALDNRIDSTSIADLLDSRREGYDLAVVLESDGKPVARSGTLLANDAQIRNDPAIGRVIATLKPHQEVRVEQGKIILVAVEPLLRGGALQGVLYTAEELGNSFTQAVGKVADAGIALVASPAPASETPPNNGLSFAALAAIRAGLGSNPSPAETRVLLNLDVAGAVLPVVATPLNTVGGRATLVALDPGFSVTSVTLATIGPLWLAIAVLSLLASLAAWVHWRRIGVPLDCICAILERGVKGDHALVIRTEGSAAVRRLRDEINTLLAQAHGG